MSENWTTESIVDEWTTERTLSRRKLAFLEQEFERGLQAIPEAVDFNVAGGVYCEALELETGSFWIEVIAELLDGLKGPIDGWYRSSDVGRQLYDYGHRDDYYEINQFGHRQLISRDDPRRFA